MSDKELLILDTSSIIYLVKHHIDLESELTRLNLNLSPRIPECILDELNGLSRNNLDAKTALVLLSGIEKLPSTGKGDDCILSLAKKLRCSVLTNDRDLITRLRSLNVMVYIVKGRRYVGVAK